MWTPGVPRRAGFYWYRDPGGDVSVVRCDAHGRVWCSGHGPTLQLQAVETEGEFWHAMVWPDHPFGSAWVEGLRNLGKLTH